MGKINLGIFIVFTFIYIQCKTTSPNTEKVFPDVPIREVADVSEEKKSNTTLDRAIDRGFIVTKDSVAGDTLVRDSSHVNIPEGGDKDNSTVGENTINYPPISPPFIYPKFPQKNKKPKPRPTPVVSEDSAKNTTENPVIPEISSEKMSELVKARATYEYEKTMYVHTVHRVELVISRELSEDVIQNLAPTFQDSDKLTNQITHIGDVVSAELIDPTGGQHFKIMPLSVRTQKVFTKDTFGYLWQWDVIPLKADVGLPLRLKASTKIGDADVNIPIFDTKIKVISSKKDTSIFWIGGGVLLGLLGLLIFFLVRRKKSKEKATQKIPIKLADKWQMLIGHNKTAVVLEKLIVYLKKIDSNKLEDVLVLQSSFKENRRKANLNVISTEKEGMENARINLALLELLNEMTEDR